MRIDAFCIQQQPSANQKHDQGVFKSIVTIILGTMVNSFGGRGRFIGWFILAVFLFLHLKGSAFEISGFSLGTLSWNNAAVPGVCTVEEAPSAAGPWSPIQNVFCT